MKDYYALLGLEQKATKAEIKKNYRLLATKYHPDKNSDPKAAAVFIAITEAYDTLSNRKSRARYDLSRWQALKENQAAEQSYQTVVPPRESTRSRRNKAQQKRSAKYHQSKGGAIKTLLLIKECLYILSRYILHLLAIPLMVVIIMSASTQVLAGMTTGIIIAVGTCIFVVFLAWGILKIIQNAFLEIKKDIAIFSIYYRIAHSKAITYTLSIFAFVAVVYMMILRLY